MENEKEFKKVLQRRNFYTVKDIGKLYLYALILPFAVGIVFSYISLAIVKGSGVQFPEGTNIINEMFDKYLWFSIPFVLLTQVIFFCIYFGYNKVNRIKQSSCNLSFKKTNIWTALLSVFVGIFCVLGLMLLIEGSFGSMFRAIGLKQNGIGLPLNSVGWLFINLLVAGILPGICEELLFRGMIFQGLKEKFSATTSIFLSALLFALMHQNIQQFIYPFILGCILAIVMQRTNNLIYPMLIHIFNNITTIVVSFLQEMKIINLPFESMAWWMHLVAVAVALVTFAILYVIYRFYLKKQSKIEVEKEGEPAVASSVNIGAFPVTLVCGILIAVVITVINTVG